MKKLFFAAGLLLLISTSSVVFAQTNSVYSSKITATAVEYRNDRTFAPDVDDINGLILLRFKTKFPDAVDEVWQKSRNGFMVRYTANGIQNHVYLDKKGKFQNLVRYYYESDLPDDVREKVKAVYGCKPIVSVKEITSRKIAYLVTIDEGNTWKVVRYVDGELDIFEEHEK